MPPILFHPFSLSLSCFCCIYACTMTVMRWSSVHLRKTSFFFLCSGFVMCERVRHVASPVGKRRDPIVLSAAKVEVGSCRVAHMAIHNLEHSWIPLVAPDSCHEHSPFTAKLYVFTNLAAFRLSFLFPPLYCTAGVISSVWWTTQKRVFFYHSSYCPK